VACTAGLQGASEADGHTTRILPSAGRSETNAHVETAIATGIGNARNPLVVTNGDAVVVDGGPGTLSELGHALDFGKPVAGLGTHRIEGSVGDAIDHVETVDEAVAHVEREG